MRSESEGCPCGIRGGKVSPREGPAPSADPDFLERFEQERTRRDPKDRELWATRTRPEETLVEVRSGTDVQIFYPRVLIKPGEQGVKKQEKKKKNAC